MSVNIALIIVLSVMVTVLWCNKCNENFGVDNFNHNIDTFIGGNFNNRSINSDTRPSPGTGKYNTLALSPTGWENFKPVFKEGFGWTEIALVNDLFFNKLNSIKKHNVIFFNTRISNLQLHIIHLFLDQPRYFHWSFAIDVTGFIYRVIGIVVVRLCDSNVILPVSVAKSEVRFIRIVRV